MKIFAQITTENDKLVYHIYDQQSFILDVSSASYEATPDNSWFCSTHQLPNITERILHFTNYAIDKKIATQIQDTLNSGTNVTLKYDYTTIASNIRWTSLTIRNIPSI